MTRRILSKVLDFKLLIKNNPELFNLTKLSIVDKTDLLNEDPNFYSTIIKTDESSLNDRVYYLLNLNSKKLTNKIKLSQVELKSLSNHNYISLLRKNFIKYALKERISNLPRFEKIEFFMKNPQWFMENKINYRPKLTMIRLESISKNNPKFIDTYITDFSEYLTSEYFWRYMLKYNKKYEDIFLLNTKTLDNKTSVRSIIRLHPHLIMKLNENIIQNSKLTVKEWILLISSVISETKNKNIFKNFQFSKEIIEIFKLDLTSELLIGKSKSSKPLSHAMKNVFKIEDEIISESTTDETVSPIKKRSKRN